MKYVLGIIMFAFIVGVGIWFEMLMN